MSPEHPGKIVEQEEEQMGFEGQEPDNYVYDEIGNLITDFSEMINIYWNVYGKVAEVRKYSGFGSQAGKKILTDMIAKTIYTYDGSENKVSKTVITKLDTDEPKTVVNRYIRDASGNTMAVYTGENLAEQTIYGNKRLGLYKGQVNSSTLTLGHRQYELSNHLGNVMAVIEDTKIALDEDNNSVFDYYA